jgi:putative sigma-54 modulation protein
MQITVSGQQMDVTPSLREYTAQKLERIERHFDQITTTAVVLQVEHHQHKAEATVFARGTALHANAAGEDMYAAIDSLADKLDRQIRRHKDKLSRRVRRAGRGGA